MDLYFKYFYDIFNTVGIPINENSEPIVFFCSGVLLLSVIGLLSAVNIGVYLIIIQISEHDYVQRKIADKPFLIKLVKYYKNTTIIFIISEFLFVFYTLGQIAYLSYKVIFIFI